MGARIPSLSSPIFPGTLRLLIELFFVDDEIHRRYRAKGLLDKSSKLLTGRSIIMSDSEHWRVTNAVSRQGYLDGITQSMETVDNLEWDEHKRTHQLMYDYADFQI